MFTQADRQLASRAATQHSIFTRDDALRSGFSADAIEWRAAHGWHRIHEGVYRIPGAVPTWRGDLYAACRAASPPVAVSHPAAAEFYGLPGGEEVIEILCRRWLRTQKAGIVVHESTRFDDEDIIEIDRIPVVAPARVIFDIASIRPFPKYLEMLVHAARRKRLITYDSMLHTFDRLARRGVRGVKPLRGVLTQWNPRSQPTDRGMETLLIRVLRNHGLPEPVPAIRCPRRPRPLRRPNRRRVAAVEDHCGVSEQGGTSGRVPESAG
jgi:hypothetical protein